jgi:hypothetical protein
VAGSVRAARTDAAARPGRHADREFHDAVTGFVSPADARWQVLIPAEGEAEIISHHDLAPWNLVVGPRWAFIDWDLAAPGTRLWNVSHAVHDFVPLSANSRWQRRDAGTRVRVFADAYGLLLHCSADADLRFTSFRAGVGRGSERPA